MEALASARIAVMARARAMLAWRERLNESTPAPTLIGDGVETAFGGSGLVITPAQDLAFFARSSAWRCTTCGKLHAFSERVSVAVASPCACASIEFEPQRDFAGGGSVQLLDLLPA